MSKLNYRNYFSPSFTTRVTNYFLNKGIEMPDYAPEGTDFQFDLSFDPVRLSKQADCFTTYYFSRGYNYRQIFNDTREHRQKLKCRQAYIFSYLKCLFMGISRTDVDKSRPNNYAFTGHALFYKMLYRRSFAFQDNTLPSKFYYRIVASDFFKEQILSYVLECFPFFKECINNFSDGNTFIYSDKFDSVFLNMIDNQKVKINRFSNKPSSTAKSNNVKDSDLNISTLDDTEIGEYLQNDFNPLGNSAFTPCLSTWHYTYKEFAQLKYDESTFFSRSNFITLDRRPISDFNPYTELDSSNEFDCLTHYDVHAIVGVKCYAIGRNSINYSQHSYNKWDLILGNNAYYSRDCQDSFDALPSKHDAENNKTVSNDDWSPDDETAPKQFFNTDKIEVDEPNLISHLNSEIHTRIKLEDNSKREFEDYTTVSFESLNKLILDNGRDSTYSGLDLPLEEIDRRLILSRLAILNPDSISTKFMVGNTEIDLSISDTHESIKYQVLNEDLKFNFDNFVIEPVTNSISLKNAPVSIRLPRRLLNFSLNPENALRIITAGCLLYFKVMSLKEFKAFVEQRFASSTSKLDVTIIHNDKRIVLCEFGDLNINVFNPGFSKLFSRVFRNYRPKSQ